MLTKAELNHIANRVLRNLQAADLDPEANCFLAARAIQILADGGTLVTGILNDRSHIWYAMEVGDEMLHWDVTADGIGGKRLFGVATPPDGYRDYEGYEWPNPQSEEFAKDLIKLVEPWGWI